MSDDDADDPFACFGDDDDDDDDQVESEESSEEGNKMTKSTDSRTNATPRDPDCGILAFHRGTEQSLLNHVQLELANLNLKLPDQERQNPADRPSTVLRIVDEFCMTRHWMMHVGVEKGEIMQQFVQRCCQEQNIMDKSSTRPLVVVELGTYCGYSSILLAKTLRDLDVSFHIYSVEVDSQHAQVARELIRLCSLQDHISVLLLHPGETTLEKNLKSNFISTSSPPISDDTPVTIDLLFIDHDKDLYLADLRHLEEAGLVRKGCFVAADNVLFAKIDEYRDYMKALAEQGVVETKLVESQLEYSEPDSHGLDEAKKQLLRDGVGKYCIVLYFVGDASDLKSSSLLFEVCLTTLSTFFRTFNVPQGPPNHFLRNLSTFNDIYDQAL